MLKIIHIISNSGIGGAQTHLVDLLKGADEQNFFQVVICDSNGIYTSNFNANAHKFYNLDFSKNILNLFVKIWKILKIEKPNIVHNHLFRACIVGTMATFAIRRKCKVFNNLHEEISDDASKSFLKIFFYQCIIFISQFLGGNYIAVSEYISLKLRLQGIKSKKIKLIYNGIDAKLFFPRAINLPTKPLKIAFLGRLHPQKGIGTLLKVAKKLDKEKIHLQVFGDGFLKNELLSTVAVEELPLDYQGFVKDVPELLAKVHVLILPSKWEPFGIVIAEAMACGKTVIASNVGGIPELIIDGEGGYLCPPDDVDCFVEKIQYLYDNPHLLETFGRFNRQRFEEKFTLEQMIKNIEALYES